MGEPVKYRLRSPRPVTGPGSDGEQDLRFIMDAWVRSFGDSRNPFEGQCGYRQGQRHVIASALERSQVVMACGVGGEPGPRQGDDLIYGFAVSEPRGSFVVIHYVYTKENFRRRGIASSMVKHARQGCTSANVTITSVTQPWIREKATKFKWRVAEFAPLYTLIGELAQIERKTGT